MIGFNSCSEDCDHDFIEHDYSKDIVGTWNVLLLNHAETMVVNADGTLNVTIVSEGKLYEQSAHYELEGNQITITNDDTDDVEKGRLDVVPGVGLSIMIDEEEGLGYKYYYCEEDYSKDIVGMWVCTETPSAEENDMLIMTYNADGTTSFTGYFYEADDFGANMEASYKVIGDLLIHKQPDIALEMGLSQYTAMKIKYTPNANSLGDVMSLQACAKVGEIYVETNTTWLRVKQTLDLPGKKYNYSKNFVSNVKGLDKDIEFMGYTMNFAKMDGSYLDKMLKMFNISFPDANTMHCVGRYSGGDIIFDDPIVVEGNKMTVKMSQKNPAFKDVDLYAFQDQDNTQFHIYMSTTAFVNFFGNMQVTIMEQLGQLDTTDETAVKAVFDSIDDAVESINLSLVMTRAK
jgi:hypothetical protein